jgi:hypothetical protein
MKKETLEEVAQWVINNRYAKSELEKVSDFEMYNTIIDKCSKWQQERSYSEEEVLQLLQKALTHQDDGETGSLVTAQGKLRTANFYSWFEQFKKK